jgi:hypothetical protein
MTVETIVDNEYKPFVLIECACECGELINPFDSRGRPVTFKRGHQNKGKLNHRWKGGIITDSLGYIRELKKDHPKADCSGRVKKHRLVYEEYYNVCLLPWTDIDHINGIKNDNRIENLRPLSRSEHMRLHHMGCKFGIYNKGKKRKPRGVYKKRDISGRICFDCLLTGPITRNNNKIRWHFYEYVFLCGICYNHRKKLRIYHGA